MDKRNYTNLNINPCKMCMPMGAVTALKGIRNCMVLLHGSQGCSTYIRRHMSEHYNEPVDIASSSLNEEGTVYGGEKNLKKGLKNIIKLYNPEIIGVLTTCLAETIGEDIKRITREFSVEEGLENCLIIPVSTPGYRGTQFEGYHTALLEVVRKLAAGTGPTGKLNIICSSLSPGDVRNIKHILDCFDVGYTIFPDISATFDAAFSTTYRRIPEGGTRLEDICKMTGAAGTIEMGVSVDDSISPGRYLYEKFGVPLHKCLPPIGLKNTDFFVGLISQISRKPIPAELWEDRGRFVDGMVDSHKYNAEGRAVIYGEPELVLAVSLLCLENGVKPVLICTGAQNSKLVQLIDREELDDENPLILDDVDFDTIQRYADELDANILIGNSDGRVMAEKMGIPLVRIGFPIHDRVGGQRLVYTGYNGSMMLLDNITNALLERKHSNYRQSMVNKYYKRQKTLDHPCFSGSCKSARLHIPVAPSCNISCNYCSRKYDCANESRPGVTSGILRPEQALERFLKVRERLGNLTVVGIAGPGDALADFDCTKKAIELIGMADPNIIFCLSTNGLMLPHYADEIIKLGVSHVTITINAVNAEVGAKIYRVANYMGRKLAGEEGVKILIRNQLEGLRYLVSRGIICKVNIVMIKGINDNHIEQVVKKVKGCGAYMTNIMPLIPVEGSVFEDMPPTDEGELNALRKKCGLELKQMYHCKRCRADAIGTLEHDCSEEFTGSVCVG